MHKSFVNVDRYCHLYGAVLVAAGCITAYALQPLPAEHSGATPLGMTLGILAAALILLLLGYGIRRRVFRAGVGTTARWLSIHVYLGLAVMVVATLHCGFHFGLNVHTLAYALMSVVVLSGLWGAMAYLRYPRLLLEHRGGVSRERLLSNLADLDRRAVTLAAELRLELGAQVFDAVERSRLGGSIWAQLSGRDGSMILLAPPFQPGSAALSANPGQRTLLTLLARQEAAAGDAHERSVLQELRTVTVDKAVVHRALLKDVQLQSLLQYWLYLHVPLSVALLVALAIHVFVVLYYW